MQITSATIGSPWSVMLDDRCWIIYVVCCEKYLLWVMHYASILGASLCLIVVVSPRSAKAAGLADLACIVTHKLLSAFCYRHSITHIVTHNGIHKRYSQMAFTKESVVTNFPILPEP
ncbi:MAG: hypothetical protein KDD78_17435, partial [Caldilineaceae bacterium]|nr:hypothetical protein [Caldilineaceae bacterium]